MALDLIFVPFLPLVLAFVRIVTFATWKFARRIEEDNAARRERAWYPDLWSHRIEVNSSAQLFLTPGLSSKRIGSRGRKTDRDRNRKIANIVGLYDADWWNGSKLWRQESSLRHICADLDQAEIPVPSNWLWGRTPGLSRIGVDLRSWMKRWRRCRRASRGSGA
jgi:hypothetical protein